MGLGAGILGDVRPVTGVAMLVVDDRLSFLSLFFHSRRMVFTLMREELEVGCLTALAASSEVTESNENLLEGVCEGGRPSSVACAIGTPNPTTEPLSGCMVNVADDERDGVWPSDRACELR